MKTSYWFRTLGFLWLGAVLTGCPDKGPDPDPVDTANAILFVTQTPHSQDFTTIVSTFGNHRAVPSSAPRGGDLYIKYADGTLRNLTEELGYGTTPGQEIAVRDPYVHWDGEKALFAMVVGGTTMNDLTPVYFQIYEITGIAQGETAAIRKLAQPEDYNNVAPCYMSDDSIAFVSDRPRNGDRRLYPQLDEYESAPTVTGVWHMDADGGNLRILDHSPSGDFEPFVDSFGRLVFTRWDHLQRDQQADADIAAIVAGEDRPWNAVTYASEASDEALDLAPGDEVFPEQRFTSGDPAWDDLAETEREHRFNVFFPWMMHQDGTGLETLNHVGRLELNGYIPNSRTYLPEGIQDLPADADNLMHVEEDPANPGRYFMSAVPEFGTHSAGRIVAIEGAAGVNADDMRLIGFTHEDTANPIGEGANPGPEDIGLFRDPLPTSDGNLFAVHSASPYADRATANDPGAPDPFPMSSRYDFAIRELVEGEDGVWRPEGFLNPGGIEDSVMYFDNGRFRTIAYSGKMWELQPVEVAARPRPQTGTEPLPEIEQAVLETELGGAEGIDDLKQFLVNNDLALVVSRDVTIRADMQQDFNLSIDWSGHETAETGSVPKALAWLQFFVGEQVRGYDRQGRRVLARTMDDALNPPEPGAPSGAVRLGDDGSMAAFVPARRALTWQTTEMDGVPAVRERYWVTFQPGEIRSCANCHGLNNTDVFGNPGPTNPPQALTDLLQWWKAQ